MNGQILNWIAISKCSGNAASIVTSAASNTKSDLFRMRSCSSANKRIILYGTTILMAQSSCQVQVF